MEVGGEVHLALAKILVPRRFALTDAPAGDGYARKDVAEQDDVFRHNRP